jgi:hypothetical protein
MIASNVLLGSHQCNDQGGEDAQLRYVRWQRVGPGCMDEAWGAGVDGLLLLRCLASRGSRGREVVAA